MSVPKVLMAAWMAMFVMANRMDSKPVGSPSFSWVFRRAPWNRICPERQMQDPAGAHEPPCDEEGAYGLCNQCGDGHAGYAESEDQHEDGVQDNVDSAADDQDVQGAPGVPCGAQDG